MKKAKRAKRFVVFLLALALTVSTFSLDVPSASAAADDAVEISTYSGLVSFLSTHSTVKVKLANDIEVEKKFEAGEFPLAVNGVKELDLNGHNIHIKDNNQEGKAHSGYEETLFQVNGALTVGDSSGKNSKIHFDAYAYSQDKTTFLLDFSAEYNMYDTRNVFEVMDGGSLVINGGTIQAGRCKSQWIVGGGKTWETVDTPAAAYNGYATFVVRGSAVILNPGATFIMNGGELNGRYTTLIRTSFSSTQGKKTVLHINDGYFLGKAGADIFNGSYMKKLIGSGDEDFDFRIRGGEFETSKEEYIREVDEVHTLMMSDSLVSKGTRGKLNIPEEYVAGMYTTGIYSNEEIKAYTARFAVLLDGKAYNHYSLSDDQYVEMANREYLLTGHKLNVKPQTSMTVGSIKYSTGKRYGFCPDEEVILSYEYTPLWPEEEVGNFFGAGSPVAHFVNYHWHFSSEDKAYDIYTEEPSLNLVALKSLSPALYEDMAENHKMWELTCTARENYQGYHHYQPEVSSAERDLVIRNHVFKDVYGTNTAGCVYDGTQQQQCSNCGTVRTVTTEKLGHIYNDSLWYSYNQYNHGHKCTRCGEFVGGSLEEHTMKTLEGSTVVANCERPGTHVEYCTECDYVRTVTDSAKLEHTYLNRGIAQDYEKNGNGHWQICQRCGEPSPMASHKDEDSDGLCDVCGTQIPAVFVSTVGDAKPSFHSTLQVSGVPEMDDAKLKEYCRNLAAANAGGDVNAIKYARTRLGNYTKGYVAWLNKVDSTGEMAEYFNQLVSDLTNDYDNAVDAGYSVATAYIWQFDWDANMGNPKSVNDVTGSAFGRESTLDLSVRPGSGTSYDYLKTTYFRCYVTASIKCSTTVTNPKLINAKYIKNYLVSSTVETVPAMTLVYGKSSTCTEAAVSTSYLCSECGELYATEKNGETVMITCGDGNSRKQLVKVTEEELVNPNYPALGHLYDPACSHVCVRCNEIDTTDRHVAKDGTWHKVDEETHAHECVYCGEYVADIEGHNFRRVTVAEGDCKTPAQYQYVCDDCGYEEPVFTDSELGHEWVLQEGSTEATCTTDGTLYYKCSICDEEKTVIRKAQGHSIEELQPIAQTCSDDGRNHAYHCVSCDLYFSDEAGTAEIPLSDVIVPADGASHVWGTDWVYSSSARWHECELCDAKKDEESCEVLMHSALATFEGKIGVVFRLALPDGVKEDPDAYVVLSKAGKETKIKVSDALVLTENGQELHCFTQYVVAREYRENINLKLFYGNGNPVTVKGKSGTDYTTGGVDYSLETYVSRKKTSEDAKMAALAVALEDYCTAAQIYFDYNAAGLSVSDRVKNVTLAELDGYKGVFDGSYPAGMKGRSITATFESDNSFVLFYTFDDGVDPYGYQYTIDGQAASLDVSDGKYFLMVSNVPARSLDKVNAYTISDGTNTYTVKCSVLTYARSSVVNGTEARQNLGKSLYLYNQAAKAYFE